MSLDVYVMPIWRFKAGDFSSPISRLGLDVPVFTIGPEGTKRSDRRRPSLVARWRAKRVTRRLGQEISRKVGRVISWSENGDVAYGEQSGGFESLRSYAKWLDYRDLLPTFDLPPDDNYYNHPVMTGRFERPPTYPLLVEHNCFSGYFLPVDFDGVVEVEPYKSWGEFVFTRSVGSSPKLLVELSRLTDLVQADPDAAGQKGNDPLARVKEALVQLLEIARLSCERHLPIIFYG